MSNANLYAVLQGGFPKDRSKVALETPDLQYTWDDIDRATACLANLLTSLDLPAGSRVAVQVEKSPEALLLYLATLRAGLVYLPLNTAYREAEIEYFLGNAEPAVVVCASKNLDWVQRAADKAGCAHVYTLDEDRSGTLLEAAGGLSQTFKTVTRQADDLAAILYTSGTTGRSKGAMLSHGNLAANAQVLHEYWGWREDDVLLHMLPIFHVHGLFVASHGALLAGAKMIWLPKLDADQALHYLPQSTVMMGVPTYYVRLLADPRFNRDVCANMRLFISGSAPLLAETFSDFKTRSGHAILERYGMSETVMLTSNPYDPALGERLAGTVGRALPGVQVRVVDDAGAPLAAGEIGNVQVRGPNVFSGYWRMPEKTREEFTEDGWFKTGDVGRWGGESAGRQVPDDYLSIVGRSKDLIISGGFNVYPKEIETLIDDMPGVAESAVIGVPHADFGEAVVAVVVPKDGVALDAGAMQLELKSRIANFKVPKRVHIVDQLPRNTMGKVQKNVLRETYKAL
ncbi:malonyl-CoA synthase [Achromobacter piechaudii]|uniref:Long-chain-fatty-acid--CoA ligase n=3 Tax=Achromobacter TaxID=222 RepID=A0ABN7EZF3_9BURK|nr:malonyl-CoA synthase [Achromobacter piechaudii]EFF74195.1 AMP-binding enzyme [Achromobacter piechaudii ATCC 43553]KNY08829.1 malonyl-CoA synthase [Achromobacter piechaudii]CAB3701226.1 Long-chain-fatty-acid--CoA ligase [Achromobacter piechaudii]CAB3851212.1 Long-chain-fatty-acid--CoA ligase [Achromobacter piechaudii]CAB3950936.1 Long-chain-fatty-acid--CoA ligase [Achromobacter piechaudii]